MAELPYVSFDRVADLYEATRHIPAAHLTQAARLLAGEAGLGRAAPLLDAGVGTGRFARHVAAIGVPVVGIDVSRGMLCEARQRAPGLALLRGDLRRLPLRSGAFAAALMVHVLHLVADWQAVVAEVRRALAPGAPLFLATEGGQRLPMTDLYLDTAGALGLGRTRVGARSVDAILEHLAGAGATMARIDQGAITWTVTATRAEQLHYLRRNPYSHLFHVEPDAHAGLIAEVERRAAALPGGLGGVEEARSDLAVWRIAWEQGAPA
ncbi:MAG: class I SAM-dependent methyltransferase [Chthonomonadales bacterium]|nr:class I SAM-dependent methyltransferase [Chthonomonadales bacterium]